MISARPRTLIKVTFLKHFALEVWVSIYCKSARRSFSSICTGIIFSPGINKDTSETFQVLLACPHHLHVNSLYIDLNFNVVTFQLLNRQWRTSNRTIVPTIVTKV